MFLPPPTLGQGAGANLGATALYNTAIGNGALQTATSSIKNTAVGYGALNKNTSGTFNTAQGRLALYNNINGQSNTAGGANALYSNTTGSYNSAQGRDSIYFNTTGSYLTAQGYMAGIYIADGTTNNATSSNSLYLGANTKPLASGDTNEIVIGYNAVGVGSNSVVLGNSSVCHDGVEGECRDWDGFATGIITSV